MPFKALRLHPALVQATREVRYSEPTPVQARAFPAILAGRDLIATAQTGIGKTAAFLLPILHRLLALPHGTTQALVITPTRELAQQIDDVCLGLAYHTSLRVGLLVGGTGMARQEKALRAGAELLVATVPFAEILAAQTLKSIPKFASGRPLKAVLERPNRDAESASGGVGRRGDGGRPRCHATK